MGNKAQKADGLVMGGSHRKQDSYLWAMGRPGGALRRE